LGTGYVGLGKGAFGVSGSSTSWAFTCDAVSDEMNNFEMARVAEETRTRSYRPDMVGNAGLPAVTRLHLSPLRMVVAEGCGCRDKVAAEF
jgi:hypothetical protein